MKLLRLIRRHGVRDGFALWRMWLEIQARKWEPDSTPTWRTFHGERPRFAGYRRRR